MEITQDFERQADEIIAQYPVKRSAAMLIMHMVQERFGYFDDDAIKYVAKKLEVAPVEVYGMLSFYPMFTDKPRGRIHIKVCRTLSCALAGSINFADEISKLADCPVNGTKGVYTIEFVECLGNCVKGINVQVNDKLYESLKPQDAEKFFETIRKADAEGALAPAPMSATPQGEGFDSPAYKG
ncbi:MAG: NAD(P)H-dependent oxidoreductase subunit E [Opitutales bacterium]|nr:NAD(P)H-dependent oxidoreductase subunit E [Opitutales bacterium]